MFWIDDRFYVSVIGNDKGYLWTAHDEVLGKKGEGFTAESQLAAYKAAIDWCWSVK